jgi:hypothetical protein
MRVLPSIPLLVTVLLVGCTGMPETIHATRVEIGETAVLGGRDVLVFGRVVFTRNGVDMRPYGQLDQPLWQLATPETTSAAADATRRVIPFLTTGEDGRFAYVIPAGRYEMSHAQPMNHMPHIDPARAFDAPTPCRAYYLGDLEVGIEAFSWLGGLWGNYIDRVTRVEVADRLDAGLGRFTGCDGGPEPVLRALLAPIPGRAADLKSSDLATFMSIFSGGLR